MLLCGGVEFNLQLISFDSVSHSESCRSRYLDLATTEVRLWQLGAVII